MIKEQKTTSVNKRRNVDKGSISPIPVEISKCINVEDLEDAKDKQWKKQTFEADNDTYEHEGKVDWSNDDPRWGNPPTVGRPTIVESKFLIWQLEDLDTVRGTIYVLSLIHI